MGDRITLPGFNLLCLELVLGGLLAVIAGEGSVYLHFSGTKRQLLLAYLEQLKIECKNRET
jgi:hypothetical protein